MLDPTLADLLDAIRRRWWLVVALAAGLASAAFASASLMQPLYRAQITLLPAEGGVPGGSLAALAAQFGGLAGLSGAPMTGSVDQMEAFEVLRSRSVALEFVRTRGLAPQLFPARWDASSGWIVQRGGEPSPAAVATRFLSKVLRVSQDNRTGLITVAVTWHEPDTAADWANGYAVFVNETLRRRALDRAERNLEYLGRELEAVQAMEVRQAMYRLIEAQMQTKMMATVGPDFAFKVVDAALPPDPAGPVSPRKGILALVGLMLGAALGVVAAWQMSARRRSTVAGGA